MPISVGDSTTESAAGTQSVTTITLRDADTDRILLVGCCGRSSTGMLSVELSGGGLGAPVALTHHRTDILSGPRHTSIYYALDADLPPAGTYMLTSTYDASVSNGGSCAVELNGAEQAEPDESVYQYLASVSANSVSVDVEAGSVVWGVANCQDGITAVAESTGQTPLGETAWGGGRFHAHSYEEFVSAGTEAFGYSTTGTCSFFGLTAVLVREAGAGGGDTEELDGTAAGVGSASGDLFASVGLAGSVAGEATAAGDLAASVPLAGAAAGSSAATGNLTVSTELSGSSAGVATGDGSIIVDAVFSGGAEGTADTSGELASAVPLQGAAQGSAAASGELSVEGSAGLDGAAAGAGDTSGELAVAAQLSGTAGGDAVASGDLSADPGLSGSSSGEASTGGEIDVSASLSGVTSGEATAAGDLAASVPLAGTADGSSAATGNLTVPGQETLDGGADGSSTVSGDLAASVSLLGSADGSSMAAGDVTVSAELTGSAAGEGAATGNPGAAVTLSGSSSGTATAAGDLKDETEPPFDLSEALWYPSAYLVEALIDPSDLLVVAKWSKP